MQTPKSDQVKISLVQLIILAAVMMISSTSHAVPNSVQDTWANTNRTIIASDTGLLYSLPSIERSKLLGLIDHERKQLSQHSVQLQETIEKKKFGGSDLLIIAVMPGGLIYSAMKRQQLKEAEKELNLVNQRLNEFAMDQLAMEFSQLDMRIAVNLQ